MNARAPSRLLTISLALVQTLRFLGRRKPTATPRRIFIAHHLYLGDTLTVTPLLAKLRQQFPHAEVVMTVPKAIAPLYQGRPFGIIPLPYDPRDVATLKALLRISGFDLAIVPGDNRFSWLARAAGARWIVAFSGDRPAYKSWPVDEYVAFPPEPHTWADMIAMLVPGAAPPPYDNASWPNPPRRPFQSPAVPYCVLHVGASTPLKYWPAERWRVVAQHLSASGFKVAWSAGPKEKHLVREIDPESRYVSYAGELALDQLWHLVKDASLLITLDTGAAHLGRIVGTPTITLFGPGSAILSGAGDFWGNSRYAAVTIPDFRCRDQHLLFKRNIPWLRRCARSTRECQRNLCMEAISVEMVMDAVNELAIAPGRLQRQSQFLLGEEK